jgi:hypothetical protein
MDLVNLFELSSTPFAQEFITNCCGRTSFAFGFTWAPTYHKRGMGRILIDFHGDFSGVLAEHARNSSKHIHLSYSRMLKT